MYDAKQTMDLQEKQRPECECKFECKLKHLLDSDYECDTHAHTEVTSQQNTICPTPAFGKRGHKSIIQSS